MRRPGNARSSPVRTAMKPACGPPNPIGTPKRWAEPTAISAPHSPGALIRVSARRSVAAITSASFECARVASSLKSLMAPVVSGYWTSTPKKLSEASTASASTSNTLMPSGLARVITTAFVWGCRLRSIRNRASSLAFEVRLAKVMASAAAVDSSSIDALEIARAVISVMTV